uniref:alpha/beta hydrolase n=1 Tax=Deefgea rivuli TaxID=400948 RepID=UPI0012EBF243
MWAERGTEADFLWHFATAQQLNAFAQRLSKQQAANRHLTVFCRAFTSLRCSWCFKVNRVGGSIC